MDIFNNLKKRNTEEKNPTPTGNEAGKEQTRELSRTRNVYNFNILKKALQSEKGTDLQKDNKYLFIVENDANKKTIKNAVESRYGVRVSFVNTILEKGKVKRLGRSVGRRSDVKKAVVTLKAGQKIDIT